MNDTKERRCLSGWVLVQVEHGSWEKQELRAKSLMLLLACYGQSLVASWTTYWWSNSACCP